MSVNIRIELDIEGLASREQAEAVLRGVHEVISDERLDDEVGVSMSERDGQFVVQGRTDYPVIISGYGRWEPLFRAQIEGAVKQVTKTAEIRLSCVDVDIERAMEEGTL